MQLLGKGSCTFPAKRIHEERRSLFSSLELVKGRDSVVMELRRNSICEQ
jgi:hypothetical protein